jgi:hypothetical protein
MKKALWILLSLVITSVAAKAQLPKEYTTSVHEEVQLPYPIPTYLELGTIKAEKFVYSTDSEENEYWEVFEENEKDSALVF